MSQADAYRNSFDVGADTKPETIQANASRLMADNNVSARVRELKAKLTELSLWTRLDSVQVLSDIAHGKKELSKDRISAVKELNAMHGWNAPAKVDHTSSDGSMSAIPARIELVAPKTA